MLNRLEYLTQCLQEECAEVAKAASKCQRFGFLDKHRGVVNKDQLSDELIDLRVVIEMLRDELQLRGVYLTTRYPEKEIKKRDKVENSMLESKDKNRFYDLLVDEEDDP